MRYFSSKRDCCIRSAAIKVTPGPVQDFGVQQNSHSGKNLSSGDLQKYTNVELGVLRTVKNRELDYEPTVLLHASRQRKDHLFASAAQSSDDVFAKLWSRHVLHAGI